MLHYIIIIIITVLLLIINCLYFILKKLFVKNNFKIKLLLNNLF